MPFVHYPATSSRADAKTLQRIREEAKKNAPERLKIESALTMEEAYNLFKGGKTHARIS